MSIWQSLENFGVERGYLNRSDGDDSVPEVDDLSKSRKTPIETTVTVDDKIAEALFLSVTGGNDSNLTKFIAALTTLKVSISDESTRIKTALSILSFPAKTLLEELKQAVDVSLVAESEKFDNKVVLSENSAIESFKKQFAAAKSEISVLDKRIAECVQQKSVLEEKSKTLSSDIEEKESSLETKKQVFENSLLAVKQKLQMLSQKLKPYSGGTK